MFHRMNLPPFGPAVVTTALRARGFEVDQHDLNSRLWRMWQGDEFAKADLLPLFEEQTVLDFVRGAPHDWLDTFAGRLLRDIDVAAADVVAISAGGDFSFLEVQSAAVLGAHVKRHYGKPVLVGGNNLDYLMQFKDAFHSWWVTTIDAFDAMVTGPGEDLVPDLVARFANGRTQLPMARPGVARIREGEVVRAHDAMHRVVTPDLDGYWLEDYGNHVRRHREGAGERRRADDQQWNRMQVFRFPPYLSWFANDTHAHMSGNGIESRLVIPYAFNYNCPYTCAFCTESLERNKLVHAEVDRVVEHMAGLASRYSTTYFYLFNNYFNLLNGFVEDFASRVIMHGVQLDWSDCARFNSMTYERLALLAEAGCRKLTFGLETASTKMLKIIDKKVKLSEAEQVLRWCKEVGIWADLEIITGLPHEDEETFAETTDFLSRNAEYINYFNVNRYFVAPKSLMGADPAKYGMRLRKSRTAYQGLLDANYRWLAEDQEMQYKPQNFRVYEFDEIDGRSYKQLATDVTRKIARLNALQSNDFSDTWRLLAMRRQGQLKMPSRLANDTAAAFA